MNHFVNVSPSGRNISQNCFTTKSDCLDENHTNKNTTLINKSENSYYYPSNLDPPQINEDYKQSTVNSEVYDSLRPLNDHSNGSKKAFCITLSTSAAIAEELRRVYVEHPKAISNLGIATLNFDTELQSNLPHYESQVNSDSQFKRPLSHCTSDSSTSTPKESSLLVNLLRQPSMPHSSSVPIQQQQQQQQTPIKQNPYSNVPPPPTQQYQHGYPMPQQPPTSYPQASNIPSENFPSYQVQQRMEHVNQQTLQHTPQYHQQNPLYQHQTIIQSTPEHSPAKGKKKKQITKKQQVIKEIPSQQQQQQQPISATHLQNIPVGHRPQPSQYHPVAGMHIDLYGNPQHSQPHPSQYHPQQQQQQQQQHSGGIQQSILQPHHPEYYAIQQNQHTQRIQHQMRSPYNQQYRPGMGPPQYGSIDGYTGQRQIHPPPPPGSHPHMWQNVQRSQITSQHLQQTANVQDSQCQFVHQQSYMQQMNAPPTNAQTHTSPQYPNPSMLSGQQHPQGQPHYYMNPHQSGSEQQQIAHQQQMAQQRGPSMTPGQPPQHIMRTQHPQQISQSSQSSNIQLVQSQVLHDDNFCNTIGDDLLDEVDLDSIEPMRNLGTTPNTSSNNSLQNNHFMAQQNNYLQGPLSQHTTSPSSGGGYYGTNNYINQPSMTNIPTPQQLGYPKGTSSNNSVSNSFYHQQSPQGTTSISGPNSGIISSPSPARTPATPRSQISTPIASKGPPTTSNDNGLQTKEEIERERQIASTINSVIEKAMIDTPSSCSTPSTSTPQPQVISSSQHCTNLNGSKQGVHHQQSYFTTSINYSSPAPMLNGSNEYHVTPASHMNRSFEFDQGQPSQSMPYYNDNYSKIPISSEVVHGMVNQQSYSSQSIQSTPRRKRKSDGPKEMVTPRKTSTHVPQKDVLGSSQYIINQQQQSVANQIPASSTI